MDLSDNYHLKFNAVHMQILTSNSSTKSTIEQLVNLQQQDDVMENSAKSQIWRPINFIFTEIETVKLS